MHHRLHPSSNRLETGQPQQGEGCCSQRCYFTSTIAVVAVGVFVELGVTNTVPTLNAPAISNQLQQDFWGGAQAGVAPRSASS